MDLLSLISQLLAFLLAFVVVIVLFVIVQFLSPKKSGGEVAFEATPVVKQQVSQVKFEHHMWEDYEPMMQFEILYWRGVEEPWRWNSYAEELIKYAKENLPHKYVKYEIYNTSRLEPRYQTFKTRIEQLRLKKIRRFPLICITYLYGEEYIVVDSTYKYRYATDRIDAEWDRYYGLV